MWLVLALLSAALIASVSLFEKRLLFKEHAFEFSMLLALFNAALTMPVLFFVDYASIPNVAYMLIFFCSIIDTAAFLFTMKAVRHMEISKSSPLQAFAPAITLFFAILFLREDITLLKIAGILLIVLGSYVLMRNGEAEKDKKYLLYMVSALILYGMSSIAGKYVIGKEFLGVNPLHSLALEQTLIAINFVVVGYLLYDGSKGIRHGLHKFGNAIFVMAAITVAARLCQSYATADGPVSLVIAIKRFSLLFTTLIGGELFKEEHLARKGIACLIMVAGALLVIL